jgi:hypothetical protein
MPNVYIEKDEERGDYKALQNGRVISRGPTQGQAGETAHDLRPNDTILAERVRDTPEGVRDKWRHLHGPKR